MEELIDFHVKILGANFKIRAPDYYKAKHLAAKKFNQTTTSRGRPIPYPMEFLLSVAQCEKIEKKKLGRPRSNV